MTYHDLSKDKHHQGCGQISACYAQHLREKIVLVRALMIFQPPTLVAPLNTSRMLLKMMIPTSMRLSCLANDARSSILISLLE